MGHGSKLLGQIFVYLLVLGGVAVMLMPFAWMLVTSFKLPSEVEKWPPQWTTKNLSSHRTLKVYPSFGASKSIDFSALSFKEFLNLSSFWIEDSAKNVIVLKIDDDPVRRGELHIRIDPLDVPVDIPSLSEFHAGLEEYEKSLPKDLGKIYESMMKDVSNTEDFLDRFFELFLFSKNPFMGRDFLPDELASQLSSIKEQLERYGNRLVTHSSLRITPSDDAEIIKAKESISKIVGESIEGLKEDIEKLMLSLSDYRKGLSTTLTPEEIENLRTDLEGLLHWDLRKLVANTLGYAPEFAESLFRFYESRFVSPVRAWMNLIELYQRVWDSYKAIQKGTAVNLVVRLKTPKEIHSEIKEFILSDASLEHDRILLLNLLEDVGAENLVDRYIGELNKRLFEIMDNYGFTGDRQALLVSVNELVNHIREFAPIKSVDTVMENAKNWVEMKERLFELLGNDELSISKINKFASTAQNDGLAYDILKVKWQQSKDIQALRDKVMRIKNATIPVNLPPDIKSVRCIGGKTIEIEAAYHRVWLYDSGFSVDARFSPGEVFLNFFQNYVDAWKAAPFGRYYVNTVFVATVTTILEVIIAAMAAFAFAKLEFFGRDFLFTLYLATMMVPGEVLLVPNYITLTKFGWIDTYYALIVPWVVQVFAIFLMRQHFKTLPDELFDAAKIDGASKWRFLWTVVLPLSKPVVITSALLKFVGSWNAFLWVLIVTKSPEMRTLPVGLQTFSSEVGTLYNQLMAASTFSMLPVILLFLFTQRYFIQGIARTGLK